MSQMRPATVADLPTIVALDQAIFGAYGADEDPQVIEARLKTFAAGCRVIIDDEALVAYLTTEKWATRREPALNEDPATTHQADGRILNITTLAVTPQAQRRGFGRQLLDAAQEIAHNEGCTEIILETARAKDFYLAHGFHVIGERYERGIRLDVMILGTLGLKLP